MVPVLGLTQILAWGSTYYLPAVLAKPIADDTGWSLAWVAGGLSLGLLTAGIVSPKIGDGIARFGGRPVLALSALLFSLGLAGVALAPVLPLYLLAWVIIGVGMGAGLYDAAFASLGRLYGQRARMAIATLTLFGGLASTACWPLTAVLLAELGWRGTCLAYAAIHLAIVLPLYVFALPTEARSERGPSDGPEPRSPRRSGDHISPGERPTFILLAATITLASVVSAAISVHLLTILQARDIALGAAVALGALVGPAQVGARAIEMLIGRYHHPVWTLIAATVLVAIGLGALWAEAPVIAVALMFYGAGIGIESIARGTLPLAIYGQQRYPALMGRIAMPSLIAQAAAPLLGAVLLEQLLPDGALKVLFATSLLCVLLAMALLIVLRRDRHLIPAAGVAQVDR